MRGCLGGWCKQRDMCPVYALGGDNPYERACYSNADGKSPDDEVAKVLSLQRLVQWRATAQSRPTALEVDGC